MPVTLPFQEVHKASNKIYTFGYGNRKSLNSLIFYCELHQIDLLVDVRETPRGWSTIWSKSYLEKHLPSYGIDYISLPSLGNVSGRQNWIPRDAALAQQGLTHLGKLSQRKTIALMCAELDPSRCHRVDVAKKLSAITGLLIENLA